MRIFSYLVDCLPDIRTSRVRQNIAMFEARRELELELDWEIKVVRRENEEKCILSLLIDDSVSYFILHSTKYL